MLVVLSACGRLGFEPDGASATDALAASDSAPGIPVAGLVGHWALDDTSGTTVSDSTGVHPGIWMGESAVRASSGIVGGSFEFDGTDDHVVIADHADFDLTGDLSIAAWIYLDNTGSQKVILDKKLDGATDGFRFIAYWTTLRFTFGDGVTMNIHSYAPDQIVDPGIWYHATATYDRQAVRLYLDGIEVAAIPHTEAIVTNNLALRIANYASDAYWLDGKIDDVRLYNRALGADEVAKLHCIPLGACPP
jgi:hypothetical protein